MPTRARRGNGTATAGSGDAYTLSGLLRGLLNTEDQTGSHTANEPFAMLSLEALNRLELAASDVGRIG